MSRWLPLITNRRLYLLDAFH